MTENEVIDGLRWSSILTFHTPIKRHGALLNTSLADEDIPLITVPFQITLSQHSYSETKNTGMLIASQINLYKKKCLCLTFGWHLQHHQLIFPVILQQQFGVALRKNNARQRFRSQLYVAEARAASKSWLCDFLFSC